MRTRNNAEIRPTLLGTLLAKGQDPKANTPTDILTQLLLERAQFPKTIRTKAEEYET